MLCSLLHGAIIASARAGAEKGRGAQGRIPLRPWVLPLTVQREEEVIMPYEGRGLYFEEFAVGQEIRTMARTITEADVVQFAGLSGDYNAIHTDAEYAKDTLFGERIAHGLLGLSVASGLAARAGFIEGTVQAFTGLDWKFKGAIRIGDTINLICRVSRLRALPSMGGGMVTLDLSVRNQRDEVVQQGRWSLLIKSRPVTKE
jgi:acyl dehydratase